MLPERSLISREVAVTADNASTALSGADKTPSINNACCSGLFGPTVFVAYTQPVAGGVCSHAMCFGLIKDVHTKKQKDNIRRVFLQVIVTLI